MNIQDLSDFIDLVKNPVKYEKVLQNIADEQARLTAVIETVGKVSEINSILKDAEAKTALLEQTFKNKDEALTKQVEEEIKILKAKQIKVQAAQERIDSMQAETTAANEEAKKLLASHKIREKSIADSEVLAQEKQDSLDALIAEYNEKVAKLRAVMV